MRCFPLTQILFVAKPRAQDLLISFVLDVKEGKMLFSPLLCREALYQPARVLCCAGVYHSGLSPSLSAAYTPSSPVGTMSLLRAATVNTNIPYARLLPDMAPDVGIFRPWHQAQSRLGAL